MDTDVGHIGDKKDVTIESKEQYDTYFFLKLRQLCLSKKCFCGQKNLET